MVRAVSRTRSAVPANYPGVSTGPVGDVRNRVLTGVDAEDVAHDVGDRFCFDFDPVAGCHALLLGVGVHEDVAEFVDLGLERLCRAEVVSDSDGLLQEVCDSLRSGGAFDRPTLEGEAGSGDLLGDRLPQLRVEGLRRRAAWAAPVDRVGRRAVLDGRPGRA